MVCAHAHDKSLDLRAVLLQIDTPPIIHNTSSSDDHIRNTDIQHTAIHSHVTVQIFSYRISKNFTTKWDLAYVKGWSSCWATVHKMSGHAVALPCDHMASPCSLCARMLHIRFEGWPVLKPVDPLKKRLSQFAIQQASTQLSEQLWKRLTHFKAGYSAEWPTWTLLNNT